MKQARPEGIALPRRTGTLNQRTADRAGSKGPRPYAAAARRRHGETGSARREAPVGESSVEASGLEERALSAPSPGPLAGCLSYSILASLGAPVRRLTRTLPTAPPPAPF